MNTSIVSLNKIVGWNCVSRVIDNSDSSVGMKRLRVIFKNGYGISIIQGSWSYGGKDGLFEIAPLDKDGELNGKLIGVDWDDVIGHLNESEVFDYARKISEMS